MLIAVDAGKHSTKSVSASGKYIFRTLMDSNVDAIGKSSYRVKFGTHEYIIGEDGLESSFDTSKTQLIHKLATYLSIALHGGKRVRLVVGCPLSIYTNTQAKKEYHDFIYRQYVALVVDGVYHEIGIEKLIVLPESVGVVYQNINRYRNKLVGVIDIGGLNTNAAIYDRLKPVKESVFTLSEGGEIFATRLKKEFVRLNGWNCQDYEIPHLLKDDKFKMIVADVARDHMSRIINQMKRNNWNLKYVNLIFTGGGSLLLEDAIKTILPNSVVSETAVWDNAMGFYQMGGALF